MVDFTTPFANAGSKRNPTASEKSNGFPCGPADQTLFNGLIHAIQSEIGDVISHAGLTGDANDLTQLRQAILSLIGAATGGSPTEYLLTSQAIARLPIFPEVLTGDGRINVTAPATGTVRVPSGVTFIHRGVSEVTTVETDLATSASKTYHVRWDATNGYTLQDLADTGTYNPSTLAETDSSFDTTYDDMLIARVVTNSSNIATITNLANTQRLSSQSDFEERTDNTNQAWATLPGTSVALNWSRTPTVSLNSLHGVKSNNEVWAKQTSGGGILADLGLREVSTPTRYGAVNLEYAYDDSKDNDGRARFSRTFIAH